MLMLMLTIGLIVALIGALPTWPHSRNWGYYPISGVSVVILIVLALLLTGRL
jgi:bacteriorhodopsin